MKPIKFRGRDVHTGEYRYGDIAHTAVGILIGKGFEVDPDSVAQLIATDRNGYNVYEGDPIKLADGWRCTATFRHFGAIADGDATLTEEELVNEKL